MDMEDDLDDALLAVQSREADKAVDPPVRDGEGNVLQPISMYGCIYPVNVVFWLHITPFSAVK